MTEPQTHQPTPEHGALALDLVRSAARFTRSSSRIPGVTYSSIAWRVLADLERDGASRITELAQTQRVTQPTMTTLVQRLEGEGWVVRAPDARDGRATLVSVTDAGVSALAAYREGAAALVTPVLTGLSDADRAVLARAAELMLHIADEV